MTARLTHCHGCANVREVNTVGYCADCSGRTRKRPRDLTRADRGYLREMAERGREQGGAACARGAA